MNPKHILITTIIMLLMCSGTASAWLSYDHRIEITETNHEASTLTNYPLNFTNDTNALVAAGHMQASGADCRITDASDNLISFWNELPFNVAGTKIWANASTLAPGSNTFYMYYGNDSVSSVSSGTNTFSFFDDFEDALAGDWTTDDPPVNYTYSGDWAWEQAAGQYGSTAQIQSLAVWNGALYGGTSNTGGGALLKYNETDGTWDLAASQLSGQTNIYDLIVYNNKLYGSTRHTTDNLGGRLFMFDEPNSTWVEKAGNLNSQGVVVHLHEFNGSLWGGTAHGGRLFKWNGVDAWTQMAGQYGAEIEIYRLFDYNGTLYASTANSGLLLKWSETTNSWSQQCPQLNSQCHVCEGVWRGETWYAGTQQNAKLFNWKEGNSTWTEVAPQFGAGTHLYTCIEHNGDIYAGSIADGKLLKWDNVSAWTEAAAQYGSETHIFDLVEFNNKIYGATYPHGMLLRYDSPNVWNGLQSMEIGATGDSGRPHISYTHSDDVAISCRVKTMSTVLTAFYTGDGTAFVYLALQNDKIQYYSGGWQGTETALHGNWHKVTLKNFDWAAHTFDICLGDDEDVIYAGANMHSSASYNDELAILGNGQTFCDDVYIRKYTTTEPTATLGAEEDAPSTNNDIILGANQHGMLRKNVVAAETFSTIAAGIDHDRCYTWWDSTADRWESYRVGYSYNAGKSVPEHDSYFVLMDGTGTTVSCSLASAETIAIPAGYYATYLRESTAKTLSAIKTDMGGNVNDLWAFDPTTGAWTDTGTYSVLPNQGLMVNSSTGFNWDGTVP